MRKASISKVTIYPLRVPVAREKMHCPPFMHEPLARGPTGGFDGQWFADQTIFVIKMESKGGPAGWGDVSHGYKIEQLPEAATNYLGLTKEQIDIMTDPTPQPVSTRGLHSAALDWKARQLGLPFHALFGPKVRDRVKVSYWSGFRTPEGAAAVALRAMERHGIRSLKLKAGEDTDCAGIAMAVAQAAGGKDYDLVIDPNQRWADLEDVVRRARGCTASGINVYFEDPMPASNDRLYVEVKRRTGIGIARTTDGKGGLTKLRQRCGADVLNLVREWPALISASAEAEGLGLPFWAGSAATLGLGDLASLHFALTQPAFRFGADMAASQSREHDLLSRPIQVVDGYAIVPDGPGLGLDVDEAALQEYAIGEPVVVE